MKLSKHMVTLGAVALTAGTVLVAGAASASAQGMGFGPGDMTQKIAERFSLDQAEVETFFAEQHEVRQAQMQAQFEEKLTQVVTDGKITEEQKQAILAKHEEMRSQMEANREANKDLEPEERQAEAETRREEMQAWAQSLGLDEEVLRSLMGGPNGQRGPKGMGMHRNQAE